MNPHLDAVPLAHAGRTVTVRFTWRALEVLQRDWGKEWGARFAEALANETIGDMAELVAITTGMTTEEVMDWSPPTSLTVQSLWDAYAMIKLGTKPKPEGEVDAENPLKARSILSVASAALRSARAWAGPNSGKAPRIPPAST
jgi:hypothetical protein